MNYVISEIDNGWLLRSDKATADGFVYFDGLDQLPALVDTMDKAIKVKETLDAAKEGQKPKGS